ncbi:MAG: hypothetical protein WCK58_16775 [Chloroflexota bacterium]
MTGHQVHEQAGLGRVLLAVTLVVTACGGPSTGGPPPITVAATAREAPAATGPAPTAAPAAVPTATPPATAAAQVPATATLVPVTAPVSFTLRSEAIVDGRLLPAYRCERKQDGVEAVIPLAWTGVPAGTGSLAVVMHHHPVPGDETKVSSYLLLWAISPSATGIDHGEAPGRAWQMGANKDGVAVSYTSPCSKGAGAHEYTITVYALARTPASLPDRSTTDVTYQVLADAIATVEVLGMAQMTFTGTTP